MTKRKTKTSYNFYLNPPNENAKNLKVIRDASGYDGRCHILILSSIGALKGSKDSCLLASKFIDLIFVAWKWDGLRLVAGPTLALARTFCERNSI